MGPETVPETAVRAGGDGWHPEHPGKHQPFPGTAFNHPVLQLPVPDRMHCPGAKQQVGAFCCRFWSKHISGLSYYQKKGDPAPLERVESEESRKKVLETVRAIEMHMALSCIAMGILQSLSIRLIGKASSGQLRYQRTPSKGRVPEAAIMHYLRKYFFHLISQKPELRITQIIQEWQKEPDKQWDSLVL